MYRDPYSARLEPEWGVMGGVRWRF
jgi:hypothetical protein